MVSRETPSQDVPSFDHRVTQCRSTVKVSVGKSRNDFQSHLRKTFMPSSITSSQRSSDTCGVGPADKTGKSVVRCCPSGSFTSAALHRPEKPREMIFICTSPCRVKPSIALEQIKVPDQGNQFAHERISPLRLTRAFREANRVLSSKEDEMTTRSVPAVVTRTVCE